MNAFHILLRKHPERIRRIIRRRMSEALGLEPAAGRFRRYFMELGAFEGHKTLALICWVLAGPVDELISARGTSPWRRRSSCWCCWRWS